MGQKMDAEAKRDTFSKLYPKGKQGVAKNQNIPSKG
jgi:hypothetical protein